MRANKRLLTVAAPLWLAMQCMACMGWRVEDVTPAQVIERDHPQQLRIQRIDGGREVMYRPQITNDTLWGSRHPDVRQRNRGIAVSDVTSVATLRVKTAETVTFGVVLAGLLAVFIALATWGGPFGGCCGQ